MREVKSMFWQLMNVGPLLVSPVNSISMPKTLTCRGDDDETGLESRDL